jgi:diaminohydroxyphosphoribosylaminopyrimidine deaminase / 5-amino-6-(5-phosphoribosylamino)uracil reductase
MDPAGAIGDRPRASGRDHEFMRQALALAAQGWGHTAPNPMVGAVVVAGDEVVGRGFHPRFGEPHAEVVALRDAGDHAAGATMYVTLEPCNHFGKTPPCVDAILAAGISRVEVAVRDPTRLARGGVERLHAASVDVGLGIEREAATELNAPFFFAAASDRPWVTLKLAISRDGAVADPTGQQRWMTGPESRAEVHRLRANSDAILVGVGTVLADDPELTVRDAPAPRVSPWRVVFDSDLRTPLMSRLLQTANDVPTVLIANPRAKEASAPFVAAGARVIYAETLTDGLRALRSEGVRAVFAEPGPRLAGALLRESLVDRLTIFRAPLLLGDDAPRAFASAPADFPASLENVRVVDERSFGDDTMITYALREIPCSPD